MRRVRILYKNEEAGVLAQLDDGTFTFIYDDHWINDISKPDISLTLPKAVRAFHSEHLFSFFFNMLPEGSNRQVVCRLNRIDETDDFSLLMATAKWDNIGAVTVRPMDNG
jgi:serine/threonine-protein kinase HipA